MAVCLAAWRREGEEESVFRLLVHGSDMAPQASQRSGDMTHTHTECPASAMS